MRTLPFALLALLAACGSRTGLSERETFEPPPTEVCEAFRTATDWSGCAEVPDLEEVLTRNCTNATLAGPCREAAEAFWTCMGDLRGTCVATPTMFGWTSEIDVDDVCDPLAEITNDCYRDCPVTWFCDAEGGRECQCGETSPHAGEICTIYPALEAGLPHCNDRCAACEP